LFGAAVLGAAERDHAFRRVKLLGIRRERVPKGYLNQFYSP
jgi:hypothetical protein